MDHDFTGGETVVIDYQGETLPINDVGTRDCVALASDFFALELGDCIASAPTLFLHHDRLPWLRPLDAHGPVLRVPGMQEHDDYLRGQHVDAAFERPDGVAALPLVLHVTRQRQRHRMGQQQDGLHVLSHRHGKHARVHHGDVGF